MVVDPLDVHLPSGSTQLLEANLTIVCLHVENYQLELEAGGLEARR